MLTTVVHAKSNERARGIWPDPSRYRIAIEPPLHDVHEVRLRQASIPRTDLRVAEGSLNFYLDRVVKKDARRVFVVENILVYTRSATDSIWQSYEYADVDSPLVVHQIDDAVLGGAIDGYITHDNSAAIFVYSSAGQVVSKAFAPPSSLITQLVARYSIGAMSAAPASVRARPSLTPGRSFYAYIENASSGIVRVGLATSFTPRGTRTFPLAANRSLALALGVESIANLVDPRLKWEMGTLGTRTVGLVFRESIVAYVNLEGASTVLSDKPTATTALGVVLDSNDLFEVLGITQAFGALAPDNIVATADILSIELDAATVTALPGFTNSSGLVTETAMINAIYETQAQQAASDLAATLKAAAVAQGYFDPVGGYGDARFKLVGDVTFRGDAVYGTTYASVRILDTSRRGMLVRESGWLKAVDDIEIWDSGVAEVPARRLVRFYADVPLAARYLKYAHDTTTTNAAKVATLLIGSEQQQVRVWTSQRIALPNAAAWPPINAVPTSDHKGMQMLLFARGSAYMAESALVYDVIGEGNAALHGATLVPGKRLLTAQTDTHIYAFSEGLGRFFTLDVDDANACVYMANITPTAMGSVLPMNTDEANGVIVPPGSRCFLISTGVRVQLYAPNYLYHLNTPQAATVFFTSRIPSAVSRQDNLTAVFSDALGLTEIELANHNAYERLSVDQGGDSLDTSMVPFVAWSNPTALVTNTGDFFTLRDSGDLLMYSERTSGDKPPLGLNTISANWREDNGNVVALAVADGIYRIDLVVEDLDTSNARLAIIDVATGSTDYTIQGNISSASEIMDVQDDGILLKTPDGSIFIFDAASPSSTGTLVVTGAEYDAFDNFIPYGANSWVRGNLTHVSVFEGGQLTRVVPTPAGIENALLRTVAYARVADDTAPVDMANAIVCVGSTGSTSRVVVFSADAPDEGNASAVVVLDDLLAGGYARVGVVSAQVTVSYRTISGGIATKLLPVPYEQPFFHQELRLTNVQASHASIASWTRFNNNILSEAVVSYNRGEAIYFYGDVTFEATGNLALGDEQLLFTGLGNVGFLHSEPVYNSSNAFLSSVATVYTSDGDAYVAFNSRDYIGWTVCSSTQLLASNVTLFSVSNPEGNTIYITSVDNPSGELRVIELTGARADTSGFTSIRSYPEREPTETEMPSVARAAAPSALMPNSAHIVSVSSNAAQLVFLDSIGARVTRRTLAHFGALPYTIALQASEGQVADTLADLMYSVDVNFFVSSGSSVDDTLSLNISHALVPFVLDLRHNAVLGAVLGWRDPAHLLIASSTIASQVENTSVDVGALERIFSLADGDNDGQLTAAELLNIINLPLTQIASTIDSQIIAEIENVLQSLALTATFDAVALSSMRILDPDESGTVSVTEFTQFLLNFVQNAHSVRSPGNIDEDGTRVVDMYLLVDGRDAVSHHNDAISSRPFTLLFLNVNRGERAIYQAGDYPAVVRFKPPKQTISSMEFVFFNERVNRNYDFKGLENQLVFEIEHGPRSVASERARAPDGSYTDLRAINAPDIGALMSMRRLHINPLTRLPFSELSEESDINASSINSEEDYEYDHGL